MADAYKKNEAQATTAETRDSNGIRLGEWDAGFCGCFTHCIPNCCMVYCLPFIPIAQIAQRLGLARYSYVLLTFLGLYVAELIFSTIAIMSALKDQQNYLQTGNRQISTGTAMSAQLAKVLSFAFALLFILAIWQLRTKTRERFQIPGSCVGDVFAVACCTCCTLAQMATHVQSYKPGSCDFGPPDTLPAYK